MRDSRDSIVRLGLLLWALLASLAVAADWDRFRGDARNSGVAGGALPDQPALLWTFQAEARFASAPAIVGEHVYAGNDDGRLYAIARASGKEVWRFTAESRIESTPLVLADRIVVGSADHHIYGVDRATGRELWRVETGSEVLGGANAVPDPADPARTLVLMGSYDGMVYALDPADGAVRWRYATGEVQAEGEAATNFVNGTPAVAQDQVVVGGCDSHIHIIRLRDGAGLRRINVGSYIGGSVSLRDGTIYLGHFGNRVQAYALADGALRWSYRRFDFPYFSSPAVTADTLLIGGDDKRLHALDPATGERRWLLRTRGQVKSSPVIAGERAVVAAEDGRIYLLRLADGELLWEYDTASPIVASPAVADGQFAVGNEAGQLLLFGTAAGAKAE